MAILRVGPRMQYTTIGAAVNAAASGDEIDVQAGLYQGVDNMPVIDNKSLDFVAVGGRVILTPDPTAPGVAQSKGMFVVYPGADGSLPNVSISGFDFRGATSLYADNAAAIRDFGSNLTLTNDGFYDNDDGVLSAGTGGSITIDRSVFIDNGYTGQDHNIYIGQDLNLTVTNSLFDGTMGEGHEIKSRALNNTITGNRIFDGNSRSSYSIDVPNGGNAVIQNNIIEQGPNGDNPHIIAYAEEGATNPGTNVDISNNVIVNDMPGGTLLYNGSTAATPQVRDNQLYGLNPPYSVLVDGPGAANFSNNTNLATRPMIDQTRSPLTDPATGATTPVGPVFGNDAFAPGFGNFINSLVTGTTGGGIGTGDTGVTVSIGLVSDTGSSSSDRITSNPAVEGTGQANTLVTINEGGTTLGTTTADSTGAWSFTPTRLADGPHTLVASETDPGGNTATATLNFTLDRVPPAVSMSLVSDTGFSSTDGITSNPAVKGNGDPDTLVIIKEGRTMLGTTMADITGAWSFTPAGLANGVHSFTASETDLAGNTGTATLSFTLQSYVLNGVA